ncbi:hypothetical protein GUJ93_ZPchr0011g28690 [Zizania palustris]|uniref:Uncharacterized protein n=1 Tax=Zizania palustris TaxID=103762 RepID=A0A8J5WIL6_ZIZPA|nr:hypothetical protein GUJ93_ZPchr0011g28690 [Zizania palustris]
MSPVLLPARALPVAPDPARVLSGATPLPGAPPNLISPAARPLPEAPNAAPHVVPEKPRVGFGVCDE